MKTQLLEFPFDLDTCHSILRVIGFQSGSADIGLSKGADATEEGLPLWQTDDVGTRLIEVGVIEGTAIEGRVGVTSRTAVGYTQHNAYIVWC